LYWDLFLFALVIKSSTQWWAGSLSTGAKSRGKRLSSATACAHGPEEAKFFIENASFWNGFWGVFSFSTTRASFDCIGAMEASVRMWNGSIILFCKGR
jgi:hypothetical protein